MNTEQRDAREVQSESFEAVELAALDEIVGGKINWRYHAYNAGIAISQMDPSSIASWFIM